MLVKVVFCLSTLHIYRTVAQGDCTDIRGRLISHGLHYVPGPDTCTLCICDNGQAKVCKAVLCTPPQDCRSFRVGSTCCEFICLDDVVKPNDGADASLRVAAGGAAAILLMTVGLVIYRVKKQKRRRPNRNDDQRSLTSIGYISGSMAYGGHNETGLSAWKPHGNYLPRGEAPPPYDEVVAQSRAETLRMAEQNFHRSYPASVQALARPEESMQCPGHGYVNIPRPVTQVANQQTCYAAPLLQAVHQHSHIIDNRDQPSSMPHHIITPVPVGYPGAIRLTGSLGAISNRGLLTLLQREPETERPHNVPGFYANGNMALLHRTIPRISTAIDTTILDTSLAGFHRTDRSLQNEIRRSFHKPNENNRHVYPETGRSIPRNLNLNTELSRSSNIEQMQNEIHCTPRLSVGRPRLHSEEHVSNDAKMAKSVTNLTKMADLPIPTPQTLPLTVDKPSCVCSYEGETAPGTEEADDYRHECENCKSASSSRWVLEEGWSEADEEGTQTLQRRVPPTAPPPPATATLPQPVTKQRTVMGPPSNWDNWFNTIPDSDSESEEE